VILATRNDFFALRGPSRRARFAAVRGSCTRARGVGRAAAGAAALLLALSCGGEGGEAEPAGGVPTAENGALGPPERGDWLVNWSLADPENLNPLISNDSAANAVLRWIFLSLLDVDDETLESVPLIARELPEISEDKLTYTFRLREGVTFSDGKPLTADDVVFTMKAIKHPGVRAPFARNYFESVQDVVAVDPLTVRFDLRKPYFRNTLVLGSISPLPRHYYDPGDLLAGISVAEIEAHDGLDAARRERAGRFAKSFNDDYLLSPMGPGAFVLRDPERDYQTGERIVLHHRDQFWAPNDPELGDAWVERVVIRIINDREAALVALKNGDLDTIGLTPLQWRINKDNRRFREKVETHIHVSPGYTYIGWNQRRPIFADTRVRVALSHFVDKKNIVAKVLHGLGETVESPIFVERPEYNQTLEPFPFDPARGRAILAEAGWSDSDADGVLDRVIDGARVPLRFEIITNSGNDIRRDVGLAVIDEMKRAGIDVSFRAVDWSVMLQQVRKFDFDAVILGWGMSVMVPDAYQVWHSSQAVEDGSNHVYFRNEEVDRILEEYRVTFDAARRKEMYDRFQQIIYAEQPYTFLFMQKAITAWDRRFQGVRWYPTGGTEQNEWWVPAAEQRYGRVAGGR
jgi:peptide/nickel transport system substrate-binding protein